MVGAISLELLRNRPNRQQTKCTEYVGKKKKIRTPQTRLELCFLLSFFFCGFEGSRAKNKNLRQNPGARQSPVESLSDISSLVALNRRF